MGAGDRHRAGRVTRQWDAFDWCALIVVVATVAGGVIVYLMLRDIGAVLNR